MKILKRLHKMTSPTDKAGVLITLFFILPLIVSLTVKVLSTKNIIF